MTELIGRFNYCDKCGDASIIRTVTKSGRFCVNCSDLTEKQKFDIKFTEIKCSWCGKYGLCNYTNHNRNFECSDCAAKK